MNARGLVPGPQHRYVERMPVCVACGAWGIRPLCIECRRRLRPGGSSLISNAPVRYALHHSGTGRLLVHRLKYQGLVAAADVLAQLMAPLLPSEAAVIVPISRARLRKMTYGVDAALELARRLGTISGLPVESALTPRFWWPRHVGRDRERRTAPQFRRRLSPVGPVALIDDVVTTGTTVQGALAAFEGHICSVVAATSPGMIDTSKAPIASGRPRDGSAAWQ